MNNFVYLLHFERRINPSHPCQHYLGYTTNLPTRIQQHQNGSGSRLCQVAKERHITFTVARIWLGPRSLEKQLKRRKNGRSLCPICNGQPVDPKIESLLIPF